jgi:hypothetical protein
MTPVSKHPGKPPPEVSRGNLEIQRLKETGTLCEQVAQETELPTPIYKNGLVYNNCSLSDDKHVDTKSVTACPGETVCLLNMRTFSSLPRSSARTLVKLVLLVVI